MPGVNCYVMTATTFSKTGELDEEGFRQFLRRIIDAKVGIFFGSAGAGEGHALTMDELRRVYRIGVEECRGKVPAQANLPDEHTADATLGHAQIAIEAGIDVVHLCTLEGRHGMQPTDRELIAYYDDLLSVIKHPVALAVNRQVAGYAPKAGVIAEICRRYPQIIGLRLSTTTLSGLHDPYILELKRLIDRDIDCFVQLPASLNALTMGATGVFGAEANIIPKTFRRYVDMYNAKKFDQLGSVYAELMRFNQCFLKWSQFGSARWVKMAMRVFKLPGGEGGPRRPYLMPPDDVVQKFTEDLLKLDIPEIDEMARTAGLRLPH
jgi:4-hydroxy-tetrahydrodipicolinate synthase